MTDIGYIGYIESNDLPFSLCLGFALCRKRSQSGKLKQKTNISSWSRSKDWINLPLPQKRSPAPPPRNHALWSGLMKTHGRGAVGWLASAQRIPGPQNLSHVWGVLRILSNVHIPPSASGAVPRALQTTDEISYVGNSLRGPTKETGLRFLCGGREKQVLETHWRNRGPEDFGRVFS